ncbi:MAG: outer membrane protein assembly factor BamE [Gammaproteobacteria bacterium]|nr:outer membrane protein assembly factor BamE [Gammaproteobacteria bacterium]
MRKTILLAVSLFCLALSSGCVYRAAISQGNVIKQEDLEQLEVGMTKNQVRFLLGTPMIDDPFSRQRWDYVYYLKLGRDKANQKRWVSVVFADEVVAEIRKELDLAPKL